MMGLNLAIVHAQVPALHGVQVIWRNLTAQGHPTPADDKVGFVRVGSRRAHPTLGSETDLPAVGEMGLVATVDEEVHVWVCSVPYQDDNAIIPGMTMAKHDSGVTRRINSSGECQIDLPGGVRLRSTIADIPMAAPSGQPNIRDLGANVPTYLALEHPSGLSLKISPTGDLTITGAGAIVLDACQPIAITAYGSFNLSTTATNPNAETDWAPGFVPNVDINIAAGGTLNLQGGGSRFCMKPVWDWLKTHTHSSSGSGVPNSLPTDASVLSPATLAGPHG